MLLLLDAVTWVGIWGSSGLSSKNLSSCNLNFALLTILTSLGYFGNELYRNGEKPGIVFKALCFVSFCWVLYYTLRSMSWVVPGFYFVPFRIINIWLHLLCYLSNICNIIKLPPRRM